MKHNLDSIQKLSNKIHSNNFIVISGQTYINNKSNLKFYCKTCGNIITQRVDNHLHGAKCKICSYNGSFLKFDEIKKRINLIFNGKYILSDQEISGTKNSVKVFCTSCNDYFNIRLDGLLAGHGCSRCKYNNLRLSLDRIRKKSSELFSNKYYIPEQEIKNKNTIIKIYCEDCDDYFFSTVANHLQGYGCKKCHIRKHTYKIDKIREISYNVHGPLYFIEDQEIKNTKSIIKIYCKKCDKYFNQRVSDHIHGCGCSMCNLSKGEKQIRQYLTIKNITFTPQKTFIDCRDKLLLPFDFYLPSLNTCIEYDGIQHFISKYYWGGENALKITQLHDEIKTNYCRNKNINLLRIKYDENIIEKLIKNNIN